MLVPLLTLLGIERLRLQQCLSHHFSGGASSATFFVTLTGIFTLQLGVLLLGYWVMQLNGYLHSHISGRERGPVSFELICPGGSCSTPACSGGIRSGSGGLIRTFGAAY